MLASCTAHLKLALPEHQLRTVIPCIYAPCSNLSILTFKSLTDGVVFSLGIHISAFVNLIGQNAYFALKPILLYID